MSKNDQPFHHTNVTSTYWFLKVCIISMVICWLCPSQPMALVSLWLSSRLQLLKSAPLCPWKRVCNQTGQVPSPSPCRTSQALALARKGTPDRVVSGLWDWALPWPDRGVTARGWSLGAKRQRMRAAAVPSAWSPRARTAPWASGAQGVPWGYARC